MIIDFLCLEPGCIDRAPHSHVEGIRRAFQCQKVVFDTIGDAGTEGPCERPAGHPGACSRVPTLAKLPDAKPSTPNGVFCASDGPRHGDVVLAPAQLDPLGAPLPALIMRRSTKEERGNYEPGKKDFDGTIDGAGYKRSMDDPNKPQLTQVWPDFIAGVARILMHGAKKYARGNWQRGMSYNEVLDAAKRHIAAIERGEEIDTDSGLPHLHHATCSLMFLDYYQRSDRKDEYARFDDRMYKGSTPPHVKERTVITEADNPDWVDGYRAGFLSAEAHERTSTAAFVGGPQTNG